MNHEQKEKEKRSFNRGKVSVCVFYIKIKDLMHDFTLKDTAIPLIRPVDIPVVCEWQTD